MHLRVMNPHVQAAATEWQARRGLLPSIPRQPGPGATALASGSTVGSSSFGISGVNGHLMLAATRQPAVQDVTPAR
jgi:acyl transferase domain-containing protein